MDVRKRLQVASIAQGVMLLRLYSMDNVEEGFHDLFYSGNFSPIFPIFPIPYCEEKFSYNHLSPRCIEQQHLFGQDANKFAPVEEDFWLIVPNPGIGSQ